MTDFSYWTDNDPNYLSHHGVLGMKWGVRHDRSKSSDNKRSHYSDDYTHSRELQKKGIKNLSNRELQEVNNRLTLENNYHQQQSQSNFGRQILSRYKNAVIGGIIGIAAGGVVGGVKKFGDAGLKAALRVAKNAKATFG